MNPGSPVTDLVFRAMRSDPNGQPVCGQDRRTLGVKPGAAPEGDIPIDSAGNVLPANGGMSIAPGDPLHLPKHRRPRELGGEGRDAVFQLPTAALYPALALRLDRPEHGLIEPSEPCRFIAFQNAPHATQPDWILYGGPSAPDTTPS